MHDPDIRALLLPALRQARPEALLVNEYGGLSGVVADVASFAAAAFWAWEIKSDFDTLRRLPDQLHHYAQLFHQVTVVVGPRYLAKVQVLAPDWVGLQLAQAGGIELVRPAGANPTPPQTARALWVEEAKTLCREQGLRGYSRLTSWTLPAFIHQHLAPDVVEAHVLTCLRHRYRRYLPEPALAA